jgi:phage recombination protein Bet
MSELVKIKSNSLEMPQDQIDIIKNSVCKGATDDELKYFLYVCVRTGLDPIMKQIYSISRGGNRTIQASIDGLRIIAERTKRYAPGKESTFVYDEKNQLISATSYVKKLTSDGTWHDVGSTAFLCEYCPQKNNFWQKMPRVMLSKCAEAAALRKAFPYEMGGLYSDDEMDQADIVPISLEELQKEADKFVVNKQKSELVLPLEKIERLISTEPKKKGPEVKEEEKEIEKEILLRKKEIQKIVGKENIPDLINYLINYRNHYPKKTEEDIFIKKTPELFARQFFSWQKIRSQIPKTA